MTLTESFRSAVIAMRHDGEAIRPFAGRLGVPHMTLYRFLSGASVDSDTLDRLAALVSPSTGDDRPASLRFLELIREVNMARIVHQARGGTHEPCTPRCHILADRILAGTMAALSTGAPDTEEPA
jgi:hypothetical protein